MAGGHGLTLRQSKMLLGMFAELPPLRPGQPPRSAEELIALYEQLHPEEGEEPVGE